jgi:hypothetical protein
VTEVDSPAPNDYACELYPLLATFGSVQDWDALYPFDIVGLGAEPDDGAIRAFFDQNHHPVKWGQAPFATRVFRDEMIPPAAGSRELSVRAPLWDEANHLDVLWLREQPGVDLGFLTDRLSVQEQLLAGTEPTRIRRSAGSSGSVARMQPGAAGPVYSVAAAQAAAVVGYIGGAKAEAGDLAVESDRFGLNFGSVTAVSLDGKPLTESERVLVTLAARAENQAVEWNEERTSIGQSWGHGPTIAERVPATVRLRLEGDVPPKAFVLAPDGSRLDEVEPTIREGWMSFSTRTGPASLHYELVRE